MLIIIDKKIPQQAKQNLQQWGNLLELDSNGIVYPAISGHPDIFLFQYDNKLIVSPYFATKWSLKLKENNISFEIGNTKLGNKYPKTTAYNVAANCGLFIGNYKSSDNKITELAKKHTWIESPQAYSRCNSLILNNNTVITSEVTVDNSHVNSLLINPKEIVLENFDYGFFGGCVGINDNKLFIIGSLKYHSQGEKIKNFCRNIDIEIVELYDGPFFDGGGIFFCQ